MLADMNEATAGYLAAATIAIVCVGIAALFLVKQYRTLVEPEPQVRKVSQAAPSLLWRVCSNPDSARVSETFQPLGPCSLALLADSATACHELRFTVPDLSKVVCWTMLNTPEPRQLWVSTVPGICRLAQSHMHSRMLQQRLHSGTRLVCAGGEQPQREEPHSRLCQRAAPITARCCLMSAHHWLLA